MNTATQMHTSTAIALFVKTPGLSPIKTRLVKDIGENLALSFYTQSCEALKDELSTLKNTNLYWAIAEDQSTSASQYWPNANQIFQSNGELGERIHSVYSRLKEKYDNVILIGADCPFLTAYAFKSTIQSLKNSQIVLGPAEDGGFYLFASNLIIPKEVWMTVKYSTSTTLKELEHRLQSLNPSTIYLPTEVDIDEYKDFFKIKVIRNNLNQKQKLLYDWVQLNILKK